VSSSHLPAEGNVPTQFFIIMDVDRGGESGLVAVQVYRQTNEWKLLLPLPAKNRKETAPETLTSLTDDWIEISPSHPLVLEAAPEAERLLVNFVFQASASPPTLYRILHAETRGRDIAAEISFLVEREAASQQEVEAASETIVKLQLSLVEKLSTKSSALEEAEQQGNDPSAVVALIDSELVGIEAQIADEEARQTRSRAAVERAGEALKLLQQQVEAAQNEVASGSAAAPSAHTYVLLVATFKEGGVSATSFKKLVLMYKDVSGTWKLTHEEDFAI